LESCQGRGEIAREGAEARRGLRKKKLKGGDAERLKQGDGADVFIGVHRWLVVGRDGGCVA
jgi:hypothetical protein